MWASQAASPTRRSGRDQAQGQQRGQQASPRRRSELTFRCMCRSSFAITSEVEQRNCRESIQHTFLARLPCEHGPQFSRLPFSQAGHVRHHSPNDRSVDGLRTSGLGGLGEYLDVIYEARSLGYFCGEPELCTAEQLALQCICISR